ncbi:hypothetical protein PIB30_080989 [Stylosanthes scabra]|uniref:Uncharacterized protein n=1 Tax=Stylosanthes scabra TaxID=79078 RepID=A0ABU6TTT2_9FABA|nr:hypothetical protein [Stylosanthes scabra]
MSDNGNLPTVQELFALLTALQADSRSMKEELQQLRNKQNDTRNDDDNAHDKNDEGDLNNNGNKDEDNNANHNPNDNTAHANGTAKAKKCNRPLSKEIMAF